MTRDIKYIFVREIGKRAINGGLLLNKNNNSKLREDEIACRVADEKREQ